MMKEYQVTLIDDSNKYRPVSTIVKEEQLEDIDLTKDKKELSRIRRRGITNICIKHYWDSNDLVRLGYTKVKVRLYNREEANKEKYWEIKKRKFASGEWEPSKKDARRLALEEIKAKVNNTKEK